MILVKSGSLVLASMSLKEIPLLFSFFVQQLSQASDGIVRGGGGSPGGLGVHDS